MIARVCAAQMARQIVRALHVAVVDAGPVSVVAEAPKRKPVRRKKKGKTA